MSTVHAQHLLTKLLTPSRSLFNHAIEINVMVISAGTFPSYEIFLTVLSGIFPDLKQVNFTLVDPAKHKTDLFLKRCAQFKNKISTKMVVNNLSLNAFLKRQVNRNFDLIYFEHSDLRIYPIFLTKVFGLYMYTVSLREAIPYLQNVMKKPAFIIASCLSKQEVHQLKYLLKLSFSIETQLIYLSDHYLYGGHYSNGLYFNNEYSCDIPVLAEKAAAIKSSDNCLFFTLLLSAAMMFFHLYYSTSITMSSLLFAVCILQLFFYRPGNYNKVLLTILVMMGIYSMLYKFYI